jgi:glutaredoxin-like YruB-family protein
VLANQFSCEITFPMTRPKIVLFTQPDCPPCHAIRLFLAGKGVAFEERDISADPVAVQELTGKYSSHSTPTLVIGEQVLIGFNPAQLDEILGE